eukprot:6387155-Prymnesium_polylepis.1
MSCIQPSCDGGANARGTVDPVTQHAHPGANKRHRKRAAQHTARWATHVNSDMHLHLRGDDIDQTRSLTLSAGRPPATSLRPLQRLLGVDALAACLELLEALAHHARLLDETQEVAPQDGDDLAAVGRAAYRLGPCRLALQQADLAERLAWRQRAERAPRLAHLERARREHVQPVDGIALAEDGPSSRDRSASSTASSLDTLRRRPGCACIRTGGHRSLKRSSTTTSGRLADLALRWLGRPIWASVERASGRAGQRERQGECVSARACPKPASKSSLESCSTSTADAQRIETERVRLPSSSEFSPKYSPAPSRLSTSSLPSSRVRTTSTSPLSSA